jgi:hypothetical protein
MSFSLLKASSLSRNTTFNSRLSKHYVPTMTHGKAIATVSGRTIAETDEYEVVEGNIYVRCPLASQLTLIDLISVPTFVSSGVDDCETWSDFVLQVGQDGDDDQD